MKRSPPDSITQKVRRIFGRGMLEGVRVAGIPNPEEFLMNQKRMRSVVAGLNGVATKVLSAVPLVEDWTLTQIGAELHLQGFTYTLDVVEGSGSWKGGCIGCSYDMNPGETPLETLRRMERERKF